MSAKRGVVCTVALGLFAFACSGSAPTAPDVGTEAVLAQGESGVFSASGGNSGCYTVKFNVTGPVDENGFQTAPWTVSGDLEGTQLVFPDVPGSLRFAGVTIKLSGEMHWTITGGVIPELEDFKTLFDLKNLNVVRPGSPPDIFENIGKHRALEGVEKANLEFKGVTQTPGDVSLDHQGVICP